jgi:hypothetical protein
MIIATTSLDILIHILVVACADLHHIHLTLDGINVLTLIIKIALYLASLVIGFRDYRGEHAYFRTWPVAGRQNNPEFGLVFAQIVFLVLDLMYVLSRATTNMMKMLFRVNSASEA